MTKSTSESNETFEMMGTTKRRSSNRCFGNFQLSGLLCSILIGLVAGCQNQKQADPQSKLTLDRNQQTMPDSIAPIFEDATKEANLNFQHHIGDPKNYHFPDIMVAGCGVLDFDRDGLMDIVLIDSGDFNDVLGEKTGSRTAFSNRLFRQSKPGSFTDVTDQSGIIDCGYGSGVAIGDVNNDGWPDIYFSNYGDDSFFVNQQNGSFKNVSRECGIKNPSWSSSASFFDFDRDGDLDLFVTNYVSYIAETKCANATGPPDFCSPAVFGRTSDRLYRNETEMNSNEIRFVDVSLESGIAKQEGPGLGVITGDFNKDGWPDIYVANDGWKNFLWISQKGKSFVEQAGPYGCATGLGGESQAGMGVMAGDIDGNQVDDIVVTHLDGEPNAAYLGTESLLGNTRQIYFSESSGKKGLQKISKSMTGFGLAVCDLDNDGDLDLLTANGRVTRRNSNPNSDFISDYSERNQIGINDGTGTISNHNSDDPFTSRLSVSRGLSVFDFDNDGKLDCLTTSMADDAKLYRNRCAKTENWIGFRVVDPQLGGRYVYGAVVELLNNGRTLKRVVQTDGSYLSARDPRVHFGLGNSKQIDFVKVTWPDQTVEQFSIRDIGTYVNLNRGEGLSVSGN